MQIFSREMLQVPISTEEKGQEGTRKGIAYWS